MPNKKFILLVFIVLALSALAFYFSRKNVSPEKEIPRHPTVVSVQGAAESKVFIEQRTYPGSVEGLQEIAIISRLSGTVSSVPYEIGSPIKIGALLARINDAGNLALEDNDLLTSPITGFVMSRNVSVGDSVSPGQIIATVSKTSAVKIRFYVDQAEKDSFAPGQEISVLSSANEQFSATVKNISPQADAQTKRFLIEAYPQTQSAAALLGTIVTVSLEKKHFPQEAENFILPLSAITVIQNENYIFVVQQNIATKIKVDLTRIMGENAEVSAPLTPETAIIVKGNQILREGELVSIENNS